MAEILQRCPKCSTKAPLTLRANDGSECLANHERPNGSWCVDGSLMPTVLIPQNPPEVPDWVFRFGRKGPLRGPRTGEADMRY